MVLIQNCGRMCIVVDKAAQRPRFGSKIRGHMSQNLTYDHGFYQNHGRTEFSHQQPISFSITSPRSSKSNIFLAPDLMANKLLTDFLTYESG